jgi:Arc/MetJ-type ribon-helix-helix transcriptional regulator
MEWIGYTECSGKLFNQVHEVRRSAMTTATITTRLSYPPEIEAYVREQLAKGRFADESEFATAAFEVYRELEQRHCELKADIQRSLEQAARGEVAPLDIGEIKAELAAEARATTRAG